MFTWSGDDKSVEKITVEFSTNAPGPANTLSILGLLIILAPGHMIFLLNAAAEA